MARPDSLPEWVSDPAYAARKVEPTAELKQRGWAPGDKPTAQNMNWELGHLADWVTHLDGEFTGMKTYRLGLSFPAFSVQTLGSMWGRSGNDYLTLSDGSATGAEILGYTPLPAGAVVTGVRLALAATFGVTGASVWVGRSTPLEYRAEALLTADASGGLIPLTGVPGTKGWVALALTNTVTIGAGEGLAFAFQKPSANQYSLFGAEITYSWAVSPA